MGQSSKDRNAAQSPKSTSNSEKMSAHRAGLRQWPCVYRQGHSRSRMLRITTALPIRGHRLSFLVSLSNARMQARTSTSWGKRPYQNQPSDILHTPLWAPEHPCQLWDCSFATGFMSNPPGYVSIKMSVFNDESYKAQSPTLVAILPYALPSLKTHT